MAVNVTETETKYDAPPGMALPHLEALPQVARTMVPDEDELEAEYYDTADLRLIRGGVTLRRRRGGEDAGWHLKLPAGLDSRREIRLPLGRSGGRVPAELTGGDRDLLAAADKALRRDGLRRASHSAKLERALGLDSARPGAGRLTPFTPAGQVVQAYLRSQADTLKSLDPMVRRDEPDSVHKMRVTTRRLRSTLQAFKKVIPRSRTAGLVGELRWLGEVLGESRDIEVLSGHLRDDLAGYPAELVIGPIEARIQGHFAPRRAAARTALLGALDSSRYLALRARYAGEAVTPALGKKARRFTRQVKKLQTSSTNAGPRSCGPAPATRGRRPPALATGAGCVSAPDPRVAGGVPRTGQTNQPHHEQA